jgi:hypothetical protein
LYCITEIAVVGYRRDTNTSVKMEEQQVETDGITAGGAGGSEKDLQHEQRTVVLTGSRQKSAKDRRAGVILESSRMMLKKAQQESCNNRALQSA